MEFPLKNMEMWLRASDFIPFSHNSVGVGMSWWQDRWPRRMRKGELWGQVAPWKSIGLSPQPRSRGMSLRGKGAARNMQLFM